MYGETAVLSMSSHYRQVPERNNPSFFPGIFADKISIRKIKHKTWREKD